MIRRATADDVVEIFAIFEASFGLLDFLPQLHTREEGLAFIGRCVRDSETYILGRGFAILAGPANLFVFAPSGRRHRLFFTMPLLACLFAGALLATFTVSAMLG